jgi:hypothetical protein
MLLTSPNPTSEIEVETEKLKKRLNVDVLQLLSYQNPPESLSNICGTGSSEIKNLESQGIVSCVRVLNSRLELANFSIIHFRKLPVAILVLAFNIDREMAKAIHQATGATVTFTSAIDTNAVEISFDGGRSKKLSINAEINTDQFPVLNQNVQSNLFLAGILFFIFTAVGSYFLVLFGFLKHFRSATLIFSEVASELEGGVVRYIPPKRFFIREVTQLFGVFSKFTENLSNFQNRIK